MKAVEEVCLDLRGLKCPLPVLRTRRRLRDLGPGHVVVVETTDPLAAIDIPHFCTENGHRLVSSTPSGDGHRFVIEKGVDFAPVSGVGATGAA